MGYEIDISSINKLIIDGNDIISVDIDNGSSTAFVKVNLNPYNIDDNFNELDRRISNIESQLRLKYEGDIRNLKYKIESLEREIYGKR